MDIVLYSTGCPRCKVLETKLASKGIEYTKNSNVDEMMGLGIMSVPVLSVDGTMMDFADAVAWVNNAEVPTNEH